MLRNMQFLSAFLHLLLERDFDEFCRTADCHQYGDAIVRKHSVNYKPKQKNRHDTLCIEYRGDSRIKCYVKAVRLFPRCKILDALLLTQYYATTDRFCSADHQ